MLIIVAISAQKMKRSRLWTGGKHQKVARARQHVDAASSSGLAPAGRGEQTRGPLEGDAECDVLVELWSLGLLNAKMLRDIGRAAMISAPRPQMGHLASLTDGHLHQTYVSTAQARSERLPIAFAT